MKAILFCRVSSKEQEESGYSLPAQEKLLESYTEKHDFQVLKVFSISESASGKQQREIFKKMLEFVGKSDVKIIVCEKVDRLTRNFRDAVAIDEWLEKDEERQVHLVKDSLILHKNSRSQEKLNWGIRILFAKNYIDNLSEEIRKGQKEKIAQGWLPTKPPPGYKTVGEKGHKIHVIDEEKAPLVKRTFDLYSTGNQSLTNLTEIMYQEGLRNFVGNKVVKSNLYKLLTDPFYIGKIRWNDLIYDGKHEALIDKETFDRVQQILKSKTTPKYSKHPFLFKGLIHCAECQGLITWEIQKGIIYGHCNHYRNCSQKIWSKEYEVEKQLLDVFDHLQIKKTRIVEWIRKVLKASHQDEIEYHSTALNELNERYEQFQKRLDRLYDDKLDGKISSEFYEKKLKQYSDEKETITENIQKHSQASTKYVELGINFYELSQRAKEIYLKAKEKNQQERQRQLLKLIFEQLALDEGKLSFTFSKAFQLLSEAVEATKSSKIPDLSKSADVTFEPKERVVVKGKTGDFDLQRSVLYPRRDSNPQPIA